MRKNKSTKGTSGKRVVLGRVKDPGDTSEQYGFLTPNDIFGTFDYTLIPGTLPFVSMTRLREQLIEDSITPSGLWLVRADDELNSDEYGWVCVHWPSYIKRVVWHADTFAYLRNKGCSVRGLQKMCLQDFEEVQDVIDSYKAVLLRALPPGCLLEADNPFFRQIVEMLVKPEHLNDFYDSDLSAFTNSWSFFRFGVLSRPHGRTKYSNRLSHLLNTYSSVSDQLICQALENAPEGTPTLVLTLLTALRKARYSDGKGWQKWGIAWTRAGLVFNYRQAVRTISTDNDLYDSLFKGLSRDPSADWLDPTYLLQRPPRRLPRLGVIGRTDARARSYIFEATSSYYPLFQDKDHDITARRSMHGTDFQILFPISEGNFGENILSYIQTLAYYRMATSPFAELNEDERIQELKQKKKLDKGERAVLKDEKFEIAKVARVSKKPLKEVKPRERITYVTGFNGYNLGCTLPAPTDLPVYPFNIAMVEYKGENYFSIPDDLAKAFPELLSGEFYDKDIQQATLIWIDSPSHGWMPKVLTKKHENMGTYLASHFAEIELSHFEIKRKPYGHCAERVTYLHPSVFRPDGEFNAVAEGIINHRPELNPDHVNLLTTFQTLWQWVYDLPSVIAQGKVSEEFMYNVGRETVHCPEKRLLNSATKRLQYIIDKAIHSRDERVCDLAPSHDRSAPRSKQLNSYDDFALWYSANHEIAELPWKLDEVQQATYVCKRWLPWRRPPGLITHLVKPHKQGTQPFASNQMPQLLAYAQKTFGPAFTEY
jgi:hypothetical protein